MRNIEDIVASIESTREELDALILTEKFEVYYEKSKELDSLIAEYVVLYEEMCQEEIAFA